MLLHTCVFMLNSPAKSSIYTTLCLYKMRVTTSNAVSNTRLSCHCIPYLDVLYELPDSLRLHKMKHIDHQQSVGITFYLPTYLFIFLLYLFSLFLHNKCFLQLEVLFMLFLLLLFKQMLTFFLLYTRLTSAFFVRNNEATSTSAA